MTLYIDPGTGAMLFSIITGLVSVIWFGIRKLFILLKYSTSIKVNKANNHSIVIYSDDKRYWPVFEPIVREFELRDFNVTYFTQSEDDPVLNANYTNLDAKYIGRSNAGFAKLNFLSATIVLSTTPGLDVYQWKRSKEVKLYVHIPHMLGELTTYRMFGLDFYDVLLLSNSFQVDDCRSLEKVHNEKEKECIVVGTPYFDAKYNKISSREDSKIDTKDDIIVLLAPSWGSNSIFNRFGDETHNLLIDNLISTGYKIIIRPHPQSFISEKKLMDELMKRYSELEWNKDVDNNKVLEKSDIMISDFSGVIFDYSFIYDKPVICAYKELNRDCYDAWWLNKPIWTSQIIPSLGPVIDEDNIQDIKELIDKSVIDRSYDKCRHEIRNKMWEYKGEGAQRTVDYLIKKYNELSEDTN